MIVKKIITAVASICFILGTGVFNVPEVHPKPLNLKFATFSPPNTGIYNGVFVAFVEEVKKRSNGQLNFKIYPSGTLLKRKAQWKGTVKGVTDVCWDVQVYNRGSFPLTYVLSLPFINPSSQVGTAVLHDLYDEFPEIKKEYEKVHVLWFWSTMPAEIHTVKKPVRKIEDLKGMKLATNAGTASAIKGLGAIPVVMGTGEIYQAVEKGVVDGCTGAYPVFNARRYYEITKYHTNIHLGGTATMMIMNKKRWNSLSLDMQKILSDSAEVGKKNHITFALKEKAKGIENAKTTGELIQLSPDERRRWVATAKPVWEAWVKEMEEKNLPGRKVLNRTLELVEKYSKQFAQ